MASLTLASIVNIFRPLVNSEGSCVLLVTQSEDSGAAPVEFMTAVEDFKRNDLSKIFTAVTKINEFIKLQPVQEWKLTVIYTTSETDATQIAGLQIVSV